MKEFIFEELQEEWQKLANKAAAASTEEIVQRKKDYEALIQKAFKQYYSFLEKNKIPAHTVPSLNALLEVYTFNNVYLQGNNWLASSSCSFDEDEDDGTGSYPQWKDSNC